MQINRQYKIKDGLINTYALEFFAAKHCNLKCLGCAQSSPYLNKKFADIDLFKESLNVIKKYIKPEKLKILGGEPLLHPDINDILQISQNSKIFKSVYIVTNGLYLLEMDSEFWCNVDVIRISLYQANKKFFEKNITFIEEKCNRYNVELQIRKMTTFNHIVLSSENTNEEEVKKIFDKCIYKHYTHTISEGYFYRCSPSVNLDEYLNKFDIYNYLIKNDRLEIRDNKNFGEDLKNFLFAEQPINSCKYCLGSSGKPFDHRQLSVKEIENPPPLNLSYDLYDNHR